MNPGQPKFNSEPSGSGQKKKEQAKSEKETLWEQKLAEVNKMVDRLGEKVDERIKEPVVALLVHGFTTSDSCEGHIAKKGEDEHGLSFPWVEVYAPAPEGWEESEEKQREWTIENLGQQQKMIGLLEEFYRGRETPFDARLTFDRAGAFGGFRIQSFGAKMMVLRTLEERKLKLELYRKEMNDFTKFLKDKHFSKE